MQFLEQVEQNAGGKIGKFFGVAVGFAPQSGEIDAQTIIVAFDGEGMGLAL